MDAQPGQINGDVFDRFTFAHASVGASAAAMGFGLMPTVLLALFWELIERPLKDKFPQAFPNASQDTAPNAIGDVLGVLAGWSAVRALRDF